MEFVSTVIDADIEFDPTLNKNTYHLSVLVKHSAGFLTINSKPRKTHITLTT